MEIIQRSPNNDGYNVNNAKRYSFYVVVYIVK